MNKKVHNYPIVGLSRKMYTNDNTWMYSQYLKHAYRVYELIVLMLYNWSWLPFHVCCLFYMLTNNVHLEWSRRDNSFSKKTLSGFFYVKSVNKIICTFDFIEVVLVNGLSISFYSLYHVILLIFICIFVAWCCIWHKFTTINLRGFTTMTY